MQIGLAAPTAGSFGGIIPWSNSSMVGRAAIHALAVARDPIPCAAGGAPVPASPPAREIVGTAAVIALDGVGRAAIFAPVVAREISIPSAAGVSV